MSALDASRVRETWIDGVPPVLRKQMRVALVIDGVVGGTGELLAPGEKLQRTGLHLHVDPELPVASRAQNLAGDIVDSVHQLHG